MTIINNFLGRPNARGNALSTDVIKGRTFSGDVGVEKSGELIVTESAQPETPHPYTWKAGYSPVDNVWRSVCYGNGLFVAVPYSGTGNRVMTSPDGITWTIRTSAVDNYWNSVCYGNGLFVAVSESSTNPEANVMTMRTYYEST